MNTSPKNSFRNCKVRIAQFLFVLFIITPCILYAQQAPAIEWQKCLGGTRGDEAYSIIRTSDGGYAFVGFTNSTDGDLLGLHIDTATFSGGTVWFVKLSSLGSIEWQKRLGGSRGDGGFSIIQTSDRGFLIAGYTNSNDGDVSGLHIDTTTIKYIQNDAWIVKLSSAGTIEWQKCIGGTRRDGAYSVIETSDSGYVVAGEATSVNGDISVPHDGSFWVVKLSHVGDIQWQKCLGGTNGQEYAFSIIQTPDGGYVVAGIASSYNGDVKGQHGGAYSNGNGNMGTDDIWVVRLSPLGKFLWQKCLGGSKNDRANSIIRTSDGGFIIAGYTNSDNGDVIGYHHPDTTFRETDTLIKGKDNYDAWILKFDSLGTIEWQKCLGGLGDDFAFSIIQTADGGYVFTGSTNSTDGDVTGLHGQNDAWLVKLNSSGKLLWQKCLGGSDEDVTKSVIQSADGGFVIAGHTYSKDGDASGIHEIKHGYDDDAWIVKLSAPSSVEATTISRGLNLSDYPNPATKIVHLGFDLPKSSAVDITISSVTGEQMEVIQQTEEQSGHHELDLDFSKFASGTYFITVASAGIIETISVEVAK